MKNSKNDHRSKYTQMIVKKALLELLNDKPLNNIGVTELCATASINRGTFYNHFYDVYDVYESIENVFFDDIKQKLEACKELTTPFFKEIMLFIYDNSTLANLIIKNKVSSDFLNKIVSYAKEKFIREWSSNYKNASPQMLEYIFSYNANGSIGLIFDWIELEMKEPIDEIASLIAKINTLILQNYLK